MKGVHKLKIIDIVFAGFMAIGANTLFLKASTLLHIKAESGGLLRLVLNAGQGNLRQHSFLKTNEFALFFHYLTGFVMVFIYALLFDPIFQLKGWLKGSLFALFPWMINGIIILPLLGSGMFGTTHLNMAGITYFFGANILFGIILGSIYDCLKETER